MSVAIPIPLLQHLPDVNVTPAVGVDEYLLTYDHGTGAFVLRAPAAPFAGILATGATVGATSQAQAFTLGVVSPFIAPAADGTAAWQVRKADGTTPIVTVDTTNSNVGIGTTNPGQKLDVNGNIKIYDSIYSDTGIYLRPAGGIAALFDGASTYVFGVYSAGTEGVHLAGSGVSFFNAGNVGIGTTTPATALHVVGAATITGGIRPAADGTTALQLQNAAGASVLNVDTTNARVGIGTTGPLSKLDIANISSATGGLRVGYIDGITFTGDADVMTIKYTPASSTTWLDSQTYSTGFKSDLSASTMYLARSGNVGIGDIAPAEKLDVTGNANVTGVYKVDDVQVLSNRVIDARCADVANSGDATTDGLIDALRDAMVAHGLIAAAA